MAVSSTICTSSKCVRMAENSASGTSTGVLVMASAYSSARRSASLNNLLVAYSGSASSLSSETPLSLLTAEPMSIQKGQPITVAARTLTRFLSERSTRLTAAIDCSIMPMP